MDLISRLHLIKNKSRQKKLAWIYRAMLEHRNYEYEKRILGKNIKFIQDADNLSVEKYCAYFFRNKEIALTLIEELDLKNAAELLHALDGEGYYFKQSQEDKLQKNNFTDINLFYAYRHLALKTYHDGEGYLIPTLAKNIDIVQKRLGSSLPAASKDLQKLLDQHEIKLSDVKLLSPDWSALIGHNGHLNVHLMMHKMGWWQGAPIVLAYNNRIANRPFLSLFNKLCPTFILDENISSSLWYELASLTPFLGVSHQLFRFEDGRSMYWNDAGAMALQEWESQERGFPLRDLYDSEYNTEPTNQIYLGLRKKWGMSHSDWHVCLHMRDAQTRGEQEGAGESIRNTAFENYIDAINHVTSQGGWVIRMGGNKAPKLPKMERVIDYANSPDQSPLMDLHLVRQAQMFIGTTSGFAYVASSFGIPTAMVNAISSVGLLWSKDTRFALKPIFNTREERLLSQSEIISEKWRWAYPTHESLARAGLSVQENSSDEILETVKEVLQLTLKGSTQQESPLLIKWRDSMHHMPAFYGSSIPSQYFLEKYADSLLNNDSQLNPINRSH